MVFTKQRVALIPLMLSAMSCHAAGNTLAEDVHAGFDLGTQSSLFVANATKACSLTENEANSLKLSQKKAGLALYGPLEPNFETHFEDGYAKSLPLIEKSIVNGSTKIDKSVCKDLKIKDS